MLNKIHNRGTGSGAGPVEYLLGKDGNREHSTLLRGDPEMTISLIDSSKYQKKYTSGVLSFAEPNISKDQKQEIMDSFERVTFPGLDHDQYQILWVEHLDKGRLELNYVIPNVELSSGKRLQPYYHKVDGYRMNTWQNIINDKFVLSDPHDPANKQLNKLDIVKDEETKKVIQAINNGLYKMAESGAITNRSEVITALESAGFEIARTTKNTVSIKNPENNRNIRLKGYLYEQNFRLGAGVREGHGRIHAEFKANSEQRLQSNRSILKESIKTKREYNQERYGKAGEFSQLSHIDDNESIHAKNTMVNVSSSDIYSAISGLTTRPNIIQIERANSTVTRARVQRDKAFNDKKDDSERGQENQRSGSIDREWRDLYNHSIEPKNRSNFTNRKSEPIHNDKRRKLDNDRDREALIRSIERITRNLRPASAKLGDKLQQFAGNVHSYERKQREYQKSIREHIERQHSFVEFSISRQQEHKNRDSEIGKTIDRIQRISEKMKEVRHKSPSVGRGLSM